MEILLAVLCGYLLDLLFGDPHWLPHPVQLMGWCISKGEKLLQNIRFIIGRLRKKLPGFPAVCGQISAADQIDAGAACGKSGGFDIEK